MEQRGISWPTRLMRIDVPEYPECVACEGIRSGAFLAADVIHTDEQIKEHYQAKRNSRNVTVTIGVIEARR